MVVFMVYSDQAGWIVPFYQIPALLFLLETLLGLPELANKDLELPVKFKFQINTEYFYF